MSDLPEEALIILPPNTPGTERLPDCAVHVVDLRPRQLDATGDTVEDPSQELLPRIPRAFPLPQLLLGDAVVLPTAAYRRWGEDLVDRVKEGSADVAELPDVRSLGQRAEVVDIYLQSPVEIPLPLGPLSLRPPWWWEHERLQAVGWE